MEVIFQHPSVNDGKSVTIEGFNFKNICGYCGKDTSGEVCGTLKIENEKTVEEVNLCNECSRKLLAKIALTRVPKEDKKSLDDFLSRSKK